MTRLKRPRPPDVVVLDSGGVSALAERRTERLWLRGALASGATALIPAPVLVEALPGGARDAAVNRVVADAPVRDCTESVARHAAELRQRALRGSAALSAVDAIVAAHAVTAGAAVIVTGDAARREQWGDDPRRDHVRRLSL